MNEAQHIINNTQLFLKNAQLQNQQNIQRHEAVKKGEDIPSDDDSSSDEEKTKVNQIDPHELKIFKNTVKQYIQLDNQIRKLKKQDKMILDEIKKRTDELKKQRKLIKNEVKKRADIQKSLNDGITKFMVRHNVEDLNTATGKLIYYKKKKSIILTKKIIEEKTKEYFGNHDDYQNYLQFIKKDIKNIEQAKLKRTFKGKIVI